MKGLFQDLKKIKNSVSMVKLDQEVTNFMVGFTGSGKSTFTNYALEVELKCEKKAGKYHFHPDSKA